jgi:hypothetical protein
MIIGPDPIISIELMSVLFGISFSPDFTHLIVTKLGKRLNWRRLFSDYFSQRRKGAKHAKKELTTEYTEFLGF